VIKAVVVRLSNLVHSAIIKEQLDKNSLCDIFQFYLERLSHRLCCILQSSLLTVMLNSVSFIWWLLGDWRQGRGFLCVRAILREAVKLFLTVYRLE
jgi:hypothetical protein